MNPTLLTDYNQKLSIAMAKIEVCDMMIEQLEQARRRQLNEGEIEHIYYVRSELALQKLFTKAYSDGIKCRIHTHWQTLEPQAEDYGWQTGDDSWDSVLNAQRYNMAHARWQNIEPFKTIQNDHT